MRRTTANSGVVAFKIDLSKTYDQLEWDFVKWVLKEHQVSHLIIKCIMSCLTSVSHHIVLNGNLSYVFIPFRCLW